MNIEKQSAPEFAPEAEIAAFLRKEEGKESDENNPSPLTLRGRLDALPAKERAALLRSPAVVAFYRDQVLLASRSGVAPSLGTLKERLEKSVPAEIRSALLASPQVHAYYRDSLVLAEREGAPPSLSVVADRVKFVPAEIQRGLVNDPKVAEQFPGLRERLAAS